MNGKLSINNDSNMMPAAWVFLNVNYRELYANFRKLIQFMLSLSKYLKQTQGFMQTQERTHQQTNNNLR